MSATQVVYQYTVRPNDRMECFACHRPVNGIHGAVFQFIKVNVPSGAEPQQTMRVLHADVACTEYRARERYQRIIRCLILALRHRTGASVQDDFIVRAHAIEQTQASLVQIIDILSALPAVPEYAIYSHWGKNLPHSPSNHAFILALPEQTALYCPASILTKERYRMHYSFSTVFHLTFTRLDTARTFTYESCRSELADAFARMPKPRFCHLAVLVSTEHGSSVIRADVVMFTSIAAAELAAQHASMEQDRTLVFHDLQYDSAHQPTVNRSFRFTRDMAVAKIRKDILQIASTITQCTAQSDSNVSFSLESTMDDSVSMLYAVRANQFIAVHSNVQLVAIGRPFYIWDKAQQVARRMVVQADQLTRSAPTTSVYMPIALDSHMMEDLPEEMALSGMRALKGETLPLFRV